MITLPSSLYLIGHWQVDCNKMTVSNGEKTVQLSAKVFELLKLFMSIENRLVGKEDAITHVWSDNGPVGTTGFPNAVWHLRKAFSDLGAETDEVIVTIQTKGYQLVIEPVAVDKSMDHDKTKRSMKIPILIGVATAALIIVVGVFAFNINKPVQALNNTNNSLTRITNFEGIEEQPDVSPNGQFLAFQWRNYNSNTNIYIKNLKYNTASLRKLTVSDAEEVAPVWSPDGQAIAYLSKAKSVCEVHVYELISNTNEIIDTGCKHVKFENALDWSADGKYLAYAKTSNDRVAIFKYDFDSKQSWQVSKPMINEEDVAVTFMDTSNNIGFIRQSSKSSKLIISIDNDEEKTLLASDQAIIGLAWDLKQQKFVLTKSQDGNFVIASVDVNGKLQPILENVQTPASVSVNSHNDEIIFSKHSSSEYIEEYNFVKKQSIKRISSSSRDMFGQSSRQNNNILFLSNRSGKWELWLKEDGQSKQVTNNVGSIYIPTVSPSGEKYAVNIKPKNASKSKLFLGTLDLSEPQLIALDDIDMSVQNPSWSNKEDTLYFSGRTTGKWGIYQYDISNNLVTQITDNGEVFAVEGDNGDLFVTRFNEPGIWQYKRVAKTFTKVVDDLGLSDFANFYWQDHHLYYLNRTKNFDQLIKTDMAGNDEILHSLPASTIKQYHGISPGSNESVIINKHSTNDSDIYSVKLPTS